MSLYRVVLMALVSGGVAAAAETPQIEAPIHEITVFSDRARVTRTGTVPLHGKAQRVRLPLLPPTLDPGSVRLLAPGATVRQVEVQQANLGEFPRSEAEALLKKLQALGDSRFEVHDEVAVLDAERRLLENLRPTASPTDEPRGPLRLFEPAGWSLALDFFESRAKAIGAARLTADAKARQLDKDIAEASARAAQIAAGESGRPGFKVEALLEGTRSTEIRLTYVTHGARWYPAYDVRFDPGAKQVRVNFAGLVSQETGEDWNDTKLVLSTAVPATTSTLPKLSSWRIGEKDQFIPTPVAKPEPAPPPPPFPERPLESETSDDDLRAALQTVLSDVQRGEDMRHGDLKNQVRAQLQKEERKMQRSAPKSPPPAPPPPPAAAPAPAPAQPRAAMDYEEIVQTESAPMEKSVEAKAGRRAVPTESMGFVVPRGWMPPPLPGDLPASLAGGYDFVYPAARPESIRSGGEAKRVALHSADFPVSPLVAVFPALRKEAFLIANVTNASDRPLLGGMANLYVGADLQGQAHLKTTAVGEKTDLAMGVDDAIRVERNVDVVTEEKGVFSKDDVTIYNVKIELLNPHATPVSARVVDQLPLKGDQNVEIKPGRVDPPATPDKAEGTLEWKVVLAPGAKQVLTFSYTLVRPRGARMRQW